MPIHPGSWLMKPRLDPSMPAGNEGSGVIMVRQQCGDLMVKLSLQVVRCTLSIDVSLQLLSCDGRDTSVEAASSFINPLITLAFVETMKMENHTAIVHTAAASIWGRCRKNL